MKILEVVELSNGFAYVVDEATPLVYHKQCIFDKVFGRNERMLIGEAEDGRMDFLTFHKHYGRMKAFVGRELKLQMVDGSTLTVKDDWWAEGASRWEEENNVVINGFSYATLDACIRCCVFYCTAISDDKLRALVGDFFKQHPDYKPWKYDDWREHCKELAKREAPTCR